MKDIRRTIRIVGQVIRLSVSNFTAYRMSMVLSLLSTLLWMCGMLFYFEGIFGNIETIAGYDKADLILLLGVSQSLALTYFTWFGIRFHLDSLIKTFDLDFYLLKPVNQMLFTTLSYIEVRNFMILIPTILLFRIAFAAKEYYVGGVDILLFVITLILSIMCYYLLILIGQLVSFWVVDSEAKYLMSEVHDLFQMPSDIFPTSAIKKALTYLVPLLLLSNVPFHALLGDLNPIWIAVLAGSCVLLYVIASWMWRTGVRRYCDVD